MFDFLRLIAASLIIPMLFTACRFPPSLTEPDATISPTEEISLETPQAVWDPDANALEPPSENGERTIKKTLYFTADEGYLLPVSVEIPWEDGIAMACLTRLRGDGETGRRLIRNGLYAPIPAGTGIRLEVSGGEARVDLTGMSALPDSRSERNLFAAIVNTLIGFSSVDCVTVLLDGSGEATAHGVEPPKKSGRMDINTEDSELPTSGSAKALTLYFPNRAASHFIPVTRYSGADGLYAAISALADGARLPGLIGCFPEGTIVLGAAVENGLLTVDLTADFKKIAETPGLYDLAMHTVLLTAERYAAIDEIRFTVNGVPFEL